MFPLDSFTLTLPISLRLPPVQYIPATAFTLGCAFPTAIPVPMNEKVGVSDDHGYR